MPVYVVTAIVLLPVMYVFNYTDTIHYSIDSIITLACLMFKGT